jgi:hypothetical protein
MAAGTVEDPAYNGPMAKQYPFVLDTFQSISVACLVRGREPGRKGVANSWGHQQQQQQHHHQQGHQHCQQQQQLCTR